MTFSVIFVDRLVVVAPDLIQKDQKVSESIEWKIWKNVDLNYWNGKRR